MAACCVVHFLVASTTLRGDRGTSQPNDRPLGRPYSTDKVSGRRRKLSSGAGPHSTQSAGPNLPRCPGSCTSRSSPRNGALIQGKPRRVARSATRAGDTLFCGSRWGLPNNRSRGAKAFQAECRGAYRKLRKTGHHRLPARRYILPQVLCLSTR